MHRDLSELPLVSGLFNRRHLIAGSAALGVATIPGLVLAQTPVAGLPETLAESPMLTELVMAGTVPALPERLPAQPMIVEPVHEIGAFGGTWRTAMVGGGDASWMTRTIGYENLVRWNRDWTDVIPNVAQSWDVSDDARSYTFHLREGHRWSDGEPFTAGDVAFYVNNVVGNAELTPAAPLNPFAIEVLDPVTFTISFERPNGLFIKQLATPAGALWTRYPKHYFEAFHKDFNTTDLDARIKEAGADNWVDLFLSLTNDIWQNSDLPCLYAWAIEEPLGTGTRVLMTRNPYYFKIDPAGNQLPYIDHVTFESVQDTEVLLLKAMNGELDVHIRHINTNVNKPVLIDSQEKGDYHLFDTTRASMNTCTICFNLTHKNPAMREILGDKNFRIGMSQAINRQEVIDALYVGQGETWQCAPRPESIYYLEELAKQYTEFDLDAANAALDLVMPDRDGDGWRLRADGEQFTPIIEVAANTQDLIDAMNLIATHWQAAGVNAQVSAIDRTLLTEHKANNDADCVVWTGDGGLVDAILNFTFYAPTNYEFAPAWAAWFDAINSAVTAAPEEPPVDVQEHLAMITRLREIAGDQEQFDQMMAFLQKSAEMFYVMGVSLPSSGYGIARNNVVNILDPMIEAWEYPTPGPADPPQFAFKG